MQRLGRLARFSSKPGTLTLLFLTPARKVAGTGAGGNVVGRCASGYKQRLHR